MHGWLPYSDMHRERVRAHLKHKDHGGSMESRSWDSEWWLSVLGEEYGEICRAICEFNLGNISGGELRIKLKEETTQLGAMTAAWLDALDD